MLGSEGLCQSSYSINLPMSYIILCHINNRHIRNSHKYDITIIDTLTMSESEIACDG